MQHPEAVHAVQQAQRLPVQAPVTFRVPVPGLVLRTPGRHGSTQALEAQPSSGPGRKVLCEPLMLAAANTGLATFNRTGSDQ